MYRYIKDKIIFIITLKTKKNILKHLNQEEKSNKSPKTIKTIDLLLVYKNILRARGTGMI